MTSDVDQSLLAAIIVLAILIVWHGEFNMPMLFVTICDCVSTSLLRPCKEYLYTHVVCMEFIYKSSLTNVTPAIINAHEQYMSALCL